MVSEFSIPNAFFFALVPEKHYIFEITVFIKEMIYTVIINTVEPLYIADVGGQEKIPRYRGVHEIAI